MDLRSERLKEIILRRYPSIRAFAREVNIPHGTLVSALNHGIDGMAWSKLNQICKFLNIDAENLEPLPEDLQEEQLDEQARRLWAYYRCLNDTGRAKVEEYVKDISRIENYFQMEKRGDTL